MDAIGKWLKTPAMIVSLLADGEDGNFT